MPSKIWCDRVAYNVLQSQSEIVQLARDVTARPDEVPFIWVDVDNGTQVVLGVERISAIENG